MSLRRIENWLLFLTLLFLPTQLGRHFWPQFSYVFSLRIDYLSPTLYFWDLLVAALACIWAARKPRLNKLAVNLLLSFLLSQAMTLTSAQNLGAGLVRLEQYLISGIFGIYIASSDFNLIKAKLFLPLSLSIIFSSILGIWQFSTGYTLGLWILGERTFNISTPGIAKFDFYGRQFLRPYATFPHPNVLSAYLMVATLLIWISSQHRNFLSAVSISLATVTTLISVSRSVIIAAMAAVFFLVRTKWLTVLLLLIIFVSPILYARYASILNFDSLTLVRREELSETAWRIFSENPIRGVGTNNFITFAANEVVVGPSRFLQPVHNIYLLSLAEGGLVGFIGLVILMVLPIYNLIKKRLETETKKILLLIWIIIPFLGVFDHFFLTLPQGYRLLFLCWGITIGLVSTKLQK